MFPTLLKYMESIKGGMRTLALDIANKKLEEKVEEEEPEPADKVDEVISYCEIWFPVHILSLSRSKNLKRKKLR